MPIALFRIDERLIHGQVVIGWGSSLRVDRYLVVDRDLAESSWEQELHDLGLPRGTTAEYWSPEDARSELEAWRKAEIRSVVLTRDVASMAELARGGILQGEEVNLGGIHFQRGREELLPYLYLDADDRQLLQELSEEGATVSARDLPGSPKISLETLLG